MSKSIYSVVLCLCLCMGVAHAQDTTTAVTTQPHLVSQKKAKAPVYQGTYLSLDIFNPVATAFNGGRFETSVAVDVSLWQRLFPVVELGVMGINQQQELYRYQSAGGFVKIGANYNFLNFKSDRKHDHIVYAGARYGYSYTSYQLTDAVLSNDYWQESGVYSNDKRAAHFGWLEIQVGVRVQIYKQFFMGLALQVKTFGHFYQDAAHYPTYIPGYGIDNQETNFGFLYHLCYQIPYKR